MASTAATNATRALAGRGIAFTLAEFPAVEFTSEEAAEKLGVPPREVWKTLVLEGETSGPVAAIVPTGARLSAKKLARASGNKAVALVSPGKMERLTGYVKGGCSPFGMRRPMPVYVHEAIRGQLRVFVSAGRRGVQLVMSGDALVKASGAAVADLVED